jgi:hypothetical protein
LLSRDDRPILSSPSQTRKTRMTHLVGDHVWGGSINGINFDVWEAQETGSHIELEVRGLTNDVVIGGGARVAPSGPGNMLTAMFLGPNGRSWIAILPPVQPRYMFDA